VCSGPGTGGLSAFVSPSYGPSDLSPLLNLQSEFASGISRSKHSKHGATARHPLCAALSHGMERRRPRLLRCHCRGVRTDKQAGMDTTLLTFQVRFLFLLFLVRQSDFLVLPFFDCSLLVCLPMVIVRCSWHPSCWAIHLLHSLPSASFALQVPLASPVKTRRDHVDVHRVDL